MGMDILRLTLILTNPPMKNTLLLLFLLPLLSFGQDLPIDSKTGEVVFTDVVNVNDSSTKAIDLFERAQGFLVDVFVSADDVIQYENAETGKIIVKGNFDISVEHKVLGGMQNFPIGRVSFRLDIEVRDGRYKYTFKDFYHSSSSHDGGSLNDELPDESVKLMTKTYGPEKLSNWDRIKRDTYSMINVLIIQMKESMDVAPVESEEDDW